jgi:hypothetical protein
MSTELLPRGNRVFARYPNGVTVTMERFFGGNIDYWAYHVICRAHTQEIGFWHTERYDTGSGLNYSYGELLGRNFLKFREWLVALKQFQMPMPQTTLDMASSKPNTPSSRGG